MKVVIKGWIFRYQESWMDEPRWQFSSYDYSDATHAKICEYTIETDIPDGDHIQERVAGVRKEKKQTTEEFSAKLTKLAQAEENLLALEYITPVTPLKPGDSFDDVPF